MCNYFLKLVLIILLMLWNFANSQTQLIPNPTMVYTGTDPNIICYSNSTGTGASKGADNWLNIKPISATGPASIDNCPSECNCIEYYPGWGLYDCQKYGIPFNSNDANKRTLRWFRSTPNAYIQECTGTNLLSQMVAGQEYTLMFESWGGSITGECGSGGNTTNMQVKFYTNTFSNQNTIGAPSQSFNVTYSSTEVWELFVITFTASANHRSVVFDMGPIGDLQAAGLDNVYLYEGPIPLGVDAINLNVRYLYDQQVDVIWESVNEENCSHYEVERTINGNDWENIGTVQAHGNIPGSTYYSFRDPWAHLGTSYYRIKQFDYNGDFQYSLIKSMYIEGINPALFTATYINNQLVINLDEEQSNEDLIFKVYDNTGRLIASSTYVDLKNNENKINFAALSTGVYFVIAGTHSEKFIIP